MAGYRADDRKLIATGAGPVEYRDIGSGQPIVFVHGPFVNGALWDDVVFYLPLGLRLLRLDLPLGGHHRPAAATADLTSSAMARLLLDFIETLDLQGVTLVANDGGCLICRLASASSDRRVRRIDGMLLTNCDPAGRLGHWHSAIEGPETATLDRLAAGLATPDGRRRFFERLVWTLPPDEQLDDLLGGFLTDAAIRFDAWRALRGTADASATSDDAFAGPVRIVWGADDASFPLDVGKHLAEGFMNSGFRSIPRARLLLPLDQPEALAEAVVEIVEQATRVHATGTWQGGRA
ncbi:alpha/beta hydrolase [Reyranella sp.]|uniref:alpha/beta fold hydrolase n=1 Tax=Reyranella sp. TaxID=1929291 RepID=UPI002F91D1A0